MYNKRVYIIILCNIIIVTILWARQHVIVDSIEIYTTVLYIG